MTEPRHVTYPNGGRTYIVTDHGYQLACESCSFVTKVKPSRASARGAIAAHKCR